jgi:serine phosphatase RsbU (regulator of sigma subunit)
MTCRTIIMKMMPLGLKHTDHVSINSLYIPCDRIGGDFFDYLIADDRIDLCIADVAGHGTAAAFFGLIIRTHVSGLLRQRADLVDIMNEVNDLVYRNAPDSYFITMFLCRYFPGNGSIEFMRAGHYYPFVVRSGSNEISNLKTSGPPLGCQSAGSWIKGIDRIGSGDRLIFFTDGIIETRNQQEDMFNDIGLADFLKDHAESPIESFTNELVNCLKEFSGRAWFEDDISLIVFDVRT